MQLRPVISICLSLSVLIILVGVMVVMSVLPDKNILAKSIPQYAVVFPIGFSQIDIFDMVSASQGKVIRTGVIKTIVIVASDEPDFKRDILRNGALFVFDPVVKGGCYIDNKKRLFHG